MTKRTGLSSSLRSPAAPKRSTSRAPNQDRSSLPESEPTTAKMPSGKDPRPTSRIAKPDKSSYILNNSLRNNDAPVDDSFTSRSPEVHDIGLQSRSPTPTAEARPHISHLPLSEENLRKFEQSLNSDPPPGAHMRKRTSPAKKDKKKEKEDRNSHPLNLPPDELRRLSAAIAREESARGSMDAEASDHNGTTSSPMQSPLPTPLKEAPGAFPETANGTTNGESNGVNGDDKKSPTPPPHREPLKPKVDAEACKAAGNKFFKAKDYSRAIAEYTKGSSLMDTSSFNSSY